MYVKWTSVAGKFDSVESPTGSVVGLQKIILTSAPKAWLTFFSLSAANFAQLRNS